MGEIANEQQARTSVQSELFSSVVDRVSMNLWVRISSLSCRDLSNLGEVVVDYSYCVGKKINVLVCLRARSRSMDVLAMHFHSRDNLAMCIAYSLK